MFTCYLYTEVLKIIERHREVSDFFYQLEGSLESTLESLVQVLFEIKPNWNQVSLSSLNIENQEFLEFGYSSEFYVNHYIIKNSRVHGLSLHEGSTFKGMLESFDLESAFHIPFESNESSEPIEFRVVVPLNGRLLKHSRYRKLKEIGDTIKEVWTDSTVNTEPENPESLVISYLVENILDLEDELNEINETLDFIESELHELVDSRSLDSEFQKLVVLFESESIRVKDIDNLLMNGIDEELIVRAWITAVPLGVFDIDVLSATLMEADPDDLIQLDGC